MTQQLRLHPSILMAGTVVGFGVHSSQHSIPRNLEWDPSPLWQPIVNQTHIGWDQIYQGRLFLAWAEAINFLHPEMSLMGSQIMVKIQQNIWNNILVTWKTRNEHLHRNGNNLDLPNYLQAATTHYSSITNSPAAQVALYCRPLQSLLDLPHPQVVHLGPTKTELLQPTA